MRRVVRAAISLLLLAGGMVAAGTEATADDVVVPTACTKAELPSLVTGDDRRFFRNLGDCASHVAQGGAVTIASGWVAQDPSRVSILWVATAECTDAANAALADVYGPGNFGVALSESGGPATHYAGHFSVMPTAYRADWLARLNPLIQQGCVSMYWTDYLQSAPDVFYVIDLYPLWWFIEL